MTTAAISGNAEPALSARTAAQRLVQVAPTAAVEGMTQARTHSSSLSSR